MDKKNILCFFLVVISAIGSEAATDFSMAAAKDWMNSNCAYVVAALAVLVAVLFGCLLRCEGQGTPFSFMSSNFLQSLLSLAYKDTNLIIKGTQEVCKTKFEIYQNLRLKNPSAPTGEEGNQKPWMKHTTKPENAKPEAKDPKDEKTENSKPSKDGNKPGYLKPEGENGEKDSKPWTERLKDSFKPLQFWAIKPEDKKHKALKPVDGKAQDNKPGYNDSRDLKPENEKFLLKK